MARCDLSLHFDEGKDLFHPGEIVRGTVRVRVDERVRCDALEVGLRWRTHGKGNPFLENVSSQTLFTGEWEAGAVFERAFTFEFPSGPFTYHGRYLNVVWEVYASADIPWAIDPAVEREVVLRADPRTEPNWLSAAGSSLAMPSGLMEKASGGAARETTNRPGCAADRETFFAVGCLLMLALALISFVGTGVQQGLSYARGEVPLVEAGPWIAVAGVVALLFLAQAFKVARIFIAGKKLGPVTIRLEPEMVRAGDEPSLNIGCRPVEAMELVAVTAHLAATEIVVRGSGTNKRTFQHVVHEQKLEIAGGSALSAGMPFQTTTSIRIPADAPSSFYAPNNRLAWTVTIRLDIADWPDWVGNREFLVHP